MENIDQHIQKDEDLLGDPTISPQSRRHTEEELEALKKVRELSTKVNVDKILNQELDFEDLKLFRRRNPINRNPIGQKYFENLLLNLDTLVHLYS